MAAPTFAPGTPGAQGYLDATSGQPMEPETLQAWLRAAEAAWADPTGLHGQGRRSGLLLDAARASLASSLTHCTAGPPIRPEQIWLASSVGAARDALLDGLPGPLVTSSVETAAILDAAEARPGSRIINVDPDGRVDASACADALVEAFAGARAAASSQAHGPILCLQFANAEIGTIQPDVRRPAQVPWIADASQCIGRMPLPDGWTGLWASARDWAGPPGVAICVVRDQLRWHRPRGATRGWVDGVPDVPAAVAAAMALESLVPSYMARAATARIQVDRLRAQVPALIDDVEVVGDRVHRLPHVLTFSVLYVAGEALVVELDRLGFAVASGSACTAEEQRPSHVLAAIGAYTGGNVRISLPFNCPDAAIDAFLDALPGAVARMRAQVDR